MEVLSLLWKEYTCSRLTNAFQTLVIEELLHREVDIPWFEIPYVQTNFGYAETTSFELEFQSRC